MAYLGFYFNLFDYLFYFYLKSEGKEVERKKMKGMGVGCKLLIYFQGGVEKFSGGGVEKFSCG